jgi:UDP-N-acetylmuramoyl-tripeptide--D-alanyl-D-alanine ligase
MPLWRRRLSNLTPYLLSACALVWRRLLFRTTFIVITGSVGKSTAAAALGPILASHFSTNWPKGSSNTRRALAETILRTRPWHRFVVIEVGTRAPGALRRAAWMIAPDIVVMLRVLNLHSNAFPTIEDMVAEKAAILTRLGKRGVALLNADDPRVLAMAPSCGGPVRTFGLTSDAYMAASEISAKWPQRLKFRATCGDQSAWVATNFVGEHMVYSALGALTAAVFCGVPLGKAAACFADIQPVPGRMWPMHLPNGVTVLRDDHNASLQTLEVALDVLRSAEASRRVLILGDVQDSRLSERPRIHYLGVKAAQSSDITVFVGALAKVASRAAIKAGMPADSVQAFSTLQEAAHFLRSELRPGDLVLVHGWMGRHIERLILAQLGSISCWLERCAKVLPCENCPELKLVAGVQAATTAESLIVLLPGRGNS